MKARGSRMTRHRGVPRVVRRRAWVASGKKALVTLAVASVLASLWGVKPSGAVPPGTTAFILDNPGDSTSVSAAVQLQTQLRNAGVSAANITISGSLPGSLASYSQVWDVRYNNGTPNLISQANEAVYNEYLQSGGRIFLMGESAGFMSRDDSIAGFLEGEGAGTVAVGAGTILALPGQQTATIIGPLATTPNRAPTVKFYATGQFTSLGGGVCVAQDASGRCAGAVWVPGSLADATAGMVVSLLDVNFLTPGTNGTDAQLFTQNLAQFFVADGAGLASNILAGSTYRASLLGTTVNPVFQGGTLLIDLASQTYARNFSLDGSGTNAIDQNSNTVIFSGVFANAVAGAPGGIIIANSGAGGAVVFSGVNLYTGTTTINTGATLALAGAGSIAASSAVIDNGGFDISATAAGATVTALTGGGTVALGRQTLTVSNGAGVFSGAIGGSGGFSLAGGAQLLTGVNSFSGPTAIGGGATLALAGAGSVAASSGVQANGVFDISATTAGASIAALTGGGSVALGARTLTVTNGAGSFAGVIAGSGGVSLAGGFQTLGGVNTFTGPTVIGGGATLALAGAGCVAASSGIVVNGVFDISATTAGASIAALTGGGSVALGARTLTLSNAAGGFAGAIGGSGGVSLAGGAQLLTGVNSFTGPTAIGGGATLALAGAGRIAASSGVLVSGVLDVSATSAGATVAGLYGGGSVLLGSKSLTLSAAAGGFAGTIAGSGGLTIGGGAQALAGANLYTGGTTIGPGSALGLGNGGASGGIVGNVADNGTLMFDRSDSVTFAGAVSGTGNVIQAGSGATILAGSNLYTGGTTINAGGTLQIGGGGGGGAIVGAIADNGTLVYDRADSVILASGIAGTGALVQAGGGTLVLNGQTGIGGATTIAAGTLVVGDASHPGAVLNSAGGGVRVGAGGTLAGHGTIVGAVSNTAAGTVRPGGSIGTLTVGSYTQGAGASLAVEVSPAAASRLAAAGTVSLNGTVRLTFDPGSYGAAIFPIVTGQSVSGTLSAVTQSGAPGRELAALSYAPDRSQVDLVLTTPNSASVYGDLATLAVDTAQAFGTGLLRALDSGFAGQPGPPAGGADMASQPTIEDERGRVWLQPFGGIGQTAGGSGVTFHSVTTGISGGAARTFDNGSVGGIGLQYGGDRMTVSGAGNSATDTAYDIGLFGEVPVGSATFAGVAFYVGTDATVSRSAGAAGTAQSSPAGRGWGGALQLGYELMGGDVAPFAQFHYLNYRLDGATETGAGALDMRMQASRDVSERGDLGVRVRHRFVLDGVEVLPQAWLGVEREFGDSGRSVTGGLALSPGSNATVASATPDRTAAVVEVKVAAKLSDRFQLFVDAGGRIGGNSQQGTALFGAAFRF